MAEDVTEEARTTLMAALTSPGTGIRRETVWWVVERVARGAHVPEEVLASARQVGPADAVETAWEAFGRDVLARAAGGAPATDSTVLIKSSAWRYRTDVQSALQLKVLTRNEQQALKAALGPPGAESAAARASSARTSGTPGMRTPDVLLWPRLLQTLLDETGCRPTPQIEMGAVGIEQNADGDRRLFANYGGLRNGCRRALGALAALTLTDRTVAARDGLQWIVLPVSAEFVACATDAANRAWASASARRGQPPSHNPAGKIMPPRKIRHVNPTYPPSAMQEGVQGRVVVETTITATGCVASAAVTTSAARALDAAAIAAVLEWAFEPTRLDGEAVPVIMTVTVAFTLP